MALPRMLLALILSISAYSASAQHIELLNSGNAVSFRGLSVVSESILWVSANKGKVGKSTNGGKSWQWVAVTGYESRDFRDIEAFDAKTAVIMAVGEPAVILRTTNGGESWKAVYENDAPGMFLDAMEFWNRESGIVVGDPLKGRFFIARTFNGGATWTAMPFNKMPPAAAGEVCFAASGTNVKVMDRDEACFVTGGQQSRLFWKGEPVALPLTQGSDTRGANSVAVWFRHRKTPLIIAVGGDFNAEGTRSGNCCISRDGGKSWIRPSNPPYGYRSCVEFITDKKIISCGTTGVDISLDEGLNWNNISATGFHVCRRSKKGNAIFLAGDNGRIGKVIF